MTDSAPLIRITDPADARIAEFTAIRERDLAGRGDRFIAEGRVVLNALLDTPAHDRFILEKLFVLENRLEGLQPVLARLPADVPVYTAERSVMDAAAGFAMHRGILALGRHRPAASLGSFLGNMPAQALLVVGIGLSNHDNMGAIFRNAGVFGADGLLIDSTSCAPLYRKAIRVSVGAALRVPFWRGGDASLLMRALVEHNFVPVGLSPHAGQDISRLRPAARTALVLGSEGAGLPGDLLAGVLNVRIAQAPGMDSLNVATASGIALWQVAQAMNRLS
ncbi:TrmH family RNA methyltransferase [Pseudohoeflea coraliihabitans]|uniref:RNA methyltransferase n=1 Tax=Pseudohoeflea coraliihabitans TaxID=2860393 RepID=A0ABS6WKU8_9HYPH|nr:RNA methyltransferase [Pseudohoeflea sp. DP4N28-3]MBW3096273.1 RNA methyltransferase [Pseudohoeflea sp. DP4N28-3]